MADSMPVAPVVPGPNGRSLTEPYHVIEIVEDNVILVSTIGRFRLKVAQTNEVLSELCSLERGKMMLDRFNAANPGLEAVLVPYRKGAAPLDFTRRLPKRAHQKTSRFLI